MADDPRLPGHDPRDAVIDAELALWGVVDLLTGVVDPLTEESRHVDRRGIEAILRLIHERLQPAAEALHHYTPRD